MIMQSAVVVITPT